MRAAFFDLDKTVIAKSSIVALGPEFHARGLLHRRTLVWAVISQMMFMRFGADDDELAKMRESRAQGHARAGTARRCARWSPSTINDVIEPLIYDEAIELIDQHLADADEVYLVSSAPEEIVEPFAELLGHHRLHPVRAQIDAEGKYTGEMEFFAQGDNKALAIRGPSPGSRGIDLDDSFAYSDSATDVPMLDSVGHPFASTPTARSAKVAAERDWPTLQLHAPRCARTTGRARARRCWSAPS